MKLFIWSMGFLCLLYSKNLTAQDVQDTGTGNLKSWTTLNLSKRLGKENWLSFGVLQSFTIQGGARNYSQPSFRWRHRLAKPWNLYLSYAPTISYQAGKPSRMAHRVRGEIRYSNRFGPWALRNSLNAEYHFPVRNKFRYRFFHTAQLTYRNDKWPLGLRPYFQTRLYYYLGGRSIEYFDENTEDIVAAAPDGFHGFRTILGLRMRASKALTLNLTYLNHREFNTSFLGGNPLNTLDPDSDRRRNQFFNFKSIGLSLSFRI